MPENYPSNPLASQFPSPAPGPGVKPIVALPSGGDARNAASVYQLAKVPADFIGHIQDSIRLEPARLAALGNGASPGCFTAPTYSGFGGTVAPSGNVKTNTGTKFVIKITAGGVVGTATFQTSIDGGATFGSTQTTAASMICATAGVLLAFAGTFAIGGTASFMSAFTPQLRHVDAAGSVRHLVDHIGYPLGDYSLVREEWLAEASPTTSGQVPNYGQIVVSKSGSTSAGGINGPRPAPLNIPWRSASIIPGGTAGDYWFWGSGGKLLGPMDQPHFSAVLQFKFMIDTGGDSNVDWYMGFSNAPAVLARGIYFRKLKAERNWQAVCQSSAITSVDTGIIPIDRIFQRFKIEFHGAASPYGLTTIFFINDIPVATVPTNIPTANSDSFYVVFGGVASSAAAVNVGYVGPWIFAVNHSL